MKNLWQNISFWFFSFISVEAAAMTTAQANLSKRLKYLYLFTWLMGFNLDTHQRRETASDRIAISSLRLRFEFKFRHLKWLWNAVFANVTFKNGTRHLCKNKTWEFSKEKEHLRKATLCGNKIRSRYELNEKILTKEFLVQFCFWNFCEKLGRRIIQKALKSLHFSYLIWFLQISEFLLVFVLKSFESSKTLLQQIL